jgi:uridine kinase
VHPVEHRGPSRPIELDSIDDLFERLQHSIDRAADTRSLILIGGCSRSGKSTLAKAIASRFRAGGVPARTLSLDRWLVSVERRSATSTVLERYDCGAIASSVTALLRGETVHPPVYDVATRRRVAERSDEGIHLESGVVIAEGVIALGLETLLPLARASIFTAVNDEVRLSRLLEFYTQTKRLTTQAASSVIGERELEEIPFIKSTSANADFIFSSR